MLGGLLFFCSVRALFPNEPTLALRLAGRTEQTQEIQAGRQCMSVKLRLGGGHGLAEYYAAGSVDNFRANEGYGLVSPLEPVTAGIGEKDERSQVTVGAQGVVAHRSRGRQV